MRRGENLRPAVWKCITMKAMGSDPPAFPAHEEEPVRGSPGVEPEILPQDTAMQRHRSRCAGGLSGPRLQPRICWWGSIARFFWP